MIAKFAPPFIKKRVSGFIEKNFHHKWYKQFVTKRYEDEKEIPKLELEQRHIQNLEIVLDRHSFLQRMPKNGVCAEIGVDQGEFSKMILEITDPSRLHLVDAWGDPSRYHDGLKLAVKDKFSSEIAMGKVEVNVGFSTVVLAKFPNQYFDWVYLDTDHSYKGTAEELQILKNKVKKGGIIAGHDYIIGNCPGDCRYGVIEAVHELCVKDNWEIILLTNETHQFRSFAIRKMQGSN